MVLATFAETKVARLPGRNPATLVPANIPVDKILWPNMSKNLMSFSLLNKDSASTLPLMPFPNGLLVSTSISLVM